MCCRIVEQLRAATIPCACWRRPVSQKHPGQRATLAAKIGEPVQSMDITHQRLGKLPPLFDQRALDCARTGFDLLAELFDNRFCGGIQGVKNGCIENWRHPTLNMP